MATSVQSQQQHTIYVDASISSDDEYYYEYEMVDDSTAGEEQRPEIIAYNNSKRQNSNSCVSVETVEVEDDDDDDDDDNYDEYTYEEETILEVVMEQTEDEMDSISAPPLHSGLGTESAPAGRTRKPPPPSTMKSPPTPSATPATVAATTGPNPIPAYVPASPNKASPVVQSSFLLQKAAGSDLLSPSKQRARAANSAGLSELSKQLRVLQAKNESQAVDINRLERQLRILADLQGISVDDLRKALEEACASEAFGELQNRVAKLKYELEAATVLKKAELRKDAAAPYIANLELKVGELEEVEEKQQLEIRQLYEGLRQERAKAMQLESENQKLKGALQDMIQTVQSDRLRAQKIEENFQKQLQEMRERQAKMMREQASLTKSSAASGNDKSKQGSTAKSTAGIVSPQMAAEYEQMVQLLKKKDEELRAANAKLHADEIRCAQQVKEAEERSREAQTKMKVKADKMALTVKELEDADGQNGLRLAQFKARFTVQNERIVDMGQQLDSLYTAFDIYKEEFDSEREQRENMLSNLKDADEKIARQTEEMEETKKKSQPRSSRYSSRSHREVPDFPPSSPVSHRSVPSFVNTTSPRVASARRKPGFATKAPVSPATPVTHRPYVSPPVYTNSTTQYSPSMQAEAEAHSNYSVNFDDTPTTYATAQAYNPTPERTATTWDILRNKDYNIANRFGVDQDLDGQLIVGSLIVESNGMLRKWKSKPSRIYLRGEGYQWDIGEKRSFPLQFGVSKVEFHPNYPLSFAVSLDPTSPNAPTIRAATTNEHEYHRWMTALYKATTGEEYQGGAVSSDDSAAAVAATPPPSAYHTPASTAYLRSPTTSTHEVEAEDADLQRILELSKYET